MTLSASTHKAALTDHFADPFVLWHCCDVMTFKSLKLTPFCMEILGVKNGYFNVLAVFSVWFWFKTGKMCKNKSTFFIFTIFFADIPCFFFQGEINSWEGRDRKISDPVSALVSVLYTSFGLQGWTALLELVDTAGPKVSRAILVQVCDKYRLLHGFFDPSPDLSPSRPYQPEPEGRGLILSEGWDQGWDQKSRVIIFLSYTYACKRANEIIYQFLNLAQSLN